MTYTIAAVVPVSNGGRARERHLHVVKKGAARKGLVDASFVQICGSCSPTTCNLLFELYLSCMTCAVFGTPRNNTKNDNNKTPQNKNKNMPFLYCKEALNLQTLMDDNLLLLRPLQTQSVLRSNASQASLQIQAYLFYVCLII